MVWFHLSSDNSLTPGGTASTDAQRDPSTQLLSIPKTNPIIRKSWGPSPSPPSPCKPGQPTTLHPLQPGEPDHLRRARPAERLRRSAASRMPAVSHRLPAGAPALRLPRFWDAPRRLAPASGFHFGGRGVRAPRGRAEGPWDCLAVTSLRGRTRRAVGGREKGWDGAGGVGNSGCG